MELPWKGGRDVRTARGTDHGGSAAVGCGLAALSWQGGALPGLSSTGSNPGSKLSATERIIVTAGMTGLRQSELSGFDAAVIC